MKKTVSLFAVIVLVVSMLAMASCGKAELSGEAIDDKSMTITASKSDAGDYFVTGSLVFEEGEQLSIEPNLESGEMTIEFINSEGMDNPDVLPDMEGEAQYTAFVSGSDAQTVDMPAGTYMVKVTVTEKATGTVAINVVAN
jgi:hypothetical protein